MTEDLTSTVAVEIGCIRGETTCCLVASTGRTLFAAAPNQGCIRPYREWQEKSLGLDHGFVVQSSR